MHTLTLPLHPPTHTHTDTGISNRTPFNLTTIVIIAGCCFIVLIVFLIVIIIICIVRYRVKILSSEEQSYDLNGRIEEIDGSPSAKRKDTPSPKYKGRKSDSSFSSTELQTLNSEPRRAGSPPLSSYSSTDLQTLDNEPRRAGSPSLP